jgi:hypothetical protein
LGTANLGFVESIGCHSHDDVQQKVTNVTRTQGILSNASLFVVGSGSSHNNKDNQKCSNKERDARNQGLLGSSAYSTST